MISLPISIIPHLNDAPSDWEVVRVRDWADPIMNSYGYDVTRGSGNPVGQFQVVTLYVWSEVLQAWAGTWSAISNFTRLTSADLYNVARLQLLEFDRRSYSDAQLVAMKDQLLQDGYTLQQKMGWLYGSTTGKPGTVMWGSGDWWQATEGRYGTMVNGGQLVAVKKAPRVFTVTMPNHDKPEPVPMREVLPFSRADFGTPHASKPWLTQWATVANLGNVYGEYIRGHVACPVGLNPQEFDFSGAFVPTHYYLPEVWLDL